MQAVDGSTYFVDKATDTIQWEKPKELHDDDATGNDSAEWVWVPHKSEVFVPAKIIQRSADGSTRVELQSGQVEIFKKDVVLETLMWSSMQRLPSDLVMLDEMNMPLILHTLKDRFRKNNIYTNVGNILISVNPFQLLPIYSPEFLSRYGKRGMTVLEPHIYNIADAALRNLSSEPMNQSIVISGESGSGKTEATKSCLQFLAETAESPTKVEQKILLANPILEAFGNAKTVRNNNSSRFGKYIEIFFNGRNQIVGARNTQYLLEKIRVVKQNRDERNYHVFYQLLAGASAPLLDELCLDSSPMSHVYLNQSGCVSIQGVSDSQDFKVLTAAMSKLQFSADATSNIFAILAAILHLGNLAFRLTGDRASVVEQVVKSHECSNFLNCLCIFV